jgi:hypothetical protein
MSQFLMYGLQRGRLNTQGDHACTAASDTHQPAEVPVSGYAYPCVCERRGAQRLIYYPRSSDRLVS